MPPVRPEIEAATALFVEMVTGLLDDAGINYLSVSGRTKSVDVLRRQGGATPTTASLLYPDPLVDITDQIGVRVITYVHDDVAAVAELLAEELAVLDDRDMGLETARAGRFGYASRHLLVSVDASRTDPGGLRARCDGGARPCRSARCCSTRGPSSSTTSATRAPCPRSTRTTSTAASPWPPGCIELADREFSAIRDRLQQALPEKPADPDEPGHDPRINAQDLAKFLAGKYADAGWSRTDHYTWVSGLLLELGITSVDAPRRGHRTRRRRRPHRADGLHATRPARCAASTTPCSPPSARATSTSTGNAHRRASLEADSAARRRLTPRAEKAQSRVSIPSGRVRQDDVARVATCAVVTELRT